MQKSKSLSESISLKKIGSYELLISDQILSQIGLNLTPEEIKQGLSDKTSKFYILLSVPASLTMNSLILGQIQSYKLFCQKKLADYLILTNPSQEEQNQANFEDNIPQDILDFKDKLLEMQQKSRAEEQIFYDQIASSQALLKREVRDQIIQFGCFLGDFKETTQAELEVIHQNVLEQKESLLIMRQSWEELGIGVSKMLAEKGVLLFNTDDEFQHSSDLNFLKNLG